ncbi:hypothetical protein [Myroides sp. DF42-4-2]|uniref:hypothetical protein n=1 Tax=Myroides sp. DF42-4-2 TaxID=2746726 RepID=UPI0025791979|nr:hypothetical protein [Myroides sp. DF42-4-2]MDM1408912.1 hypothetical protein [Myroides sp. DF42-4-2]
MKKLFLLLSLSIVLVSCESESKKLNFDTDQNFKTQGKGFWNTALVDGAGALTGAGSVASIAGWFGWTPAAPLAAGAVALGAVIGGAGASVAYAYSYQIPIRQDYQSDHNLTVTENYIDNVGIMHNQIIVDYQAKYPVYDEATYYSFVSDNKDKYGFSAMILTAVEENKIREEIESIITHSDVIGYTLEKLPKEVNRENYTIFFENLESISVREKAISYVNQFEVKELSEKIYTDETKLLLGIYFSTLRNSMRLWNE